MAAETDSSRDDGAYFRTIEEAFIRLRGAPLLLSPADWRQAKEWNQEGIPLDLIVVTLEEVFEKRNQRGSKRSISSLRYCNRAVRDAWESAQELVATAHRQVAPSFDLAALLRRLADSLPAATPDRSQYVAAILELGNDAEAAEEALLALDSRLLAEVEAGLEDEDRSHLEETLEETTSKLSQKLPEEQVAKAYQRLRKQKLRALAGVPVLSLFAVEETET